MPNLTWQDYEGRDWPVPDPLTPLRYCIIPAHAALRAHVFTRDGFRCQALGCRVCVSPPADFDGSISPVTSRGPLNLSTIDPSRLGDRFHPDNQQTMCRSCHARALDARNRRSGAW